MKKILITGATGLVGSAIARELLSRGYSVRVLVRESSKLDNLQGLTFEKALGDVLEADRVREAVRGCDAVMHTAGIAHFKPGETDHLYKVNVVGVENVLQAALNEGIRRVVVTSSSGALGGRHEPTLLDETSESNAETLGIDYLKSKYRGEMMALCFVPRGLEVVVIRPSFILGPGDIYQSSGTTMLALARGKFPVYVEGGASFTDVRDVAFGHVQALEKGRSGQTYLLGGENLAMNEVVRRTAAMAGVSAPRRAPFWLALASATVIETAAGLLGKTPDLTRQLVRASSLYTYVNSALAEKELGYQHRLFEESLRDTLRFFIRCGRLIPNTAELKTLANG